MHMPIMVDRKAAGEQGLGSVRSGLKEQSCRMRRGGAAAGGVAHVPSSPRGGAGLAALAAAPPDDGRGVGAAPGLQSPRQVVHSQSILCRVYRSTREAVHLARFSTCMLLRRAEAAQAGGLAGLLEKQAQQRKGAEQQGEHQQDWPWQG